MLTVSDPAGPLPHGPVLPAPRGDLSAAVLAALGRSPGPALALPTPSDADPLTDEDLQLALYVCYELHYRGFAGVDPAWEWDPALLACRRTLEQRFETRVRDAAGPAPERSAADELRRLAGGDDGPSLSGYVESDGTLEQFREMCIHRSAWQLKEADPHSWAISRLSGPAKATLVALQHDEYGAGEPEDMHSALFADTMRLLDLDPGYGAYLDRLPAITLATVNLVSMFGLHRRLEGALVGHLALFEMTSVGPMSAYSRALARLGLDAEARRFFDVHVAADARHGEIAVSELVPQLVGDDAAAAREVMFGARALTDVERRFTEHMLGSWTAGRSSLRSPA